MFDSREHVIDKVFNPLKVTKSSLIEFSIGDLKDTGLYTFEKIIEFKAGDMSYARYVIYSKSEDAEFVFEVVPGNGGLLETCLYSLSDTVAFSDDFLDVSGQLYLTTPEGNEYIRCVMPEEEDRIDGTRAKARVYNIVTDEVESQYSVKLWEYCRDIGGRDEYLNIEMSGENGMFKIFTGEIIEEIFYKFYQTSKTQG